MLTNLLFSIPLISSVSALPIFDAKSTDTETYGSQEHLFQLLGGAGPYFSYPHSYGISTDIPNQCTIEQVQLFARHGERFPTKNTGAKYQTLWEKMEPFKGSFKGNLSFFNDYDYFVKDTSNYEQETNTSNVIASNPYMGEVDAINLGQYVWSNYKNLISNEIPVFSSSDGRVYDTAKNFVKGLNQYGNLSVSIQIIPEGDKYGANSLTPGDSCTLYDSSENSDYVANMTSEYLSNARKRVTSENPQVNLTNADMSTLFSWCAYEINVKGYSPVCSLFTQDEFFSYSYSVDLENFYKRGSGNSLAKAVGSVLFNASYALLKDSEKLGNNVWLSFTHDTDLQQYFTAVGLLDDGKTELPNDYVPFVGFTQHYSWVTPMGARIFTEKLRCGNESYVRYIVNDAVIPIEGCSTGPGYSCKFSDFEKYVKKRLNDISYYEQCKVNSSAASELGFYWDYKNVDYTTSSIDY